ncbi:MAG: reverse transcriptase family protein [Pseudomonadota bacterium]
MFQTKAVLARWLAFSLCTGDWRTDAIVARLSESVPGLVGEYTFLAKRLRARFDTPQPPTRAACADYLRTDPAFARVLEHARRLNAWPLSLAAPTMTIAPASQAQALPQLPTIARLADWLMIPVHEVDWFCRRLHDPELARRRGHYRYRWVDKRSGGQRLLEIPKRRLKAVQRQIATELVAKLPVHDCAHGYVPGRSTRSYVAPHIAQAALLRFDLKDFFISVSSRQVYAIFSSFGYPSAVAHALARLTTNAVPAAIVGACPQQLHHENAWRYARAHLPPGAPTSAALSNLALRRFDARLAGLAARMGLNYSRYADDLAFSWVIPARGKRQRLESMVGAIAIDEGFVLNHNKTRSRAASDRQKLAGIVVNAKPNVPRVDYDRLKATLHNCVRSGPASQNHDCVDNFREHLLGRVNYVRWLNPARGERLLALWRQIQWPQDAIIEDE